MRLVFWSALSVFVFASALASAYPLVPNPKMTTGEVCTTSDPDFKEYRYAENIAYCQRNVSTGLKTQIYHAYGIPDGCRYRYTIDHFIPLSIGGSNHPANLWPEHKLVKALRPKLEDDLYAQMKAGTISQKVAIQTVLDAKWHPVSNGTPAIVDLNCDQVDP